MAFSTDSPNKEFFSIWLMEKLGELSIDDNVFENYILGILEGDENEDEKREALEGILSELHTETSDTVEMILKKWNESHPKEIPKEEPKLFSFDEQLDQLLGSQKILATKKEYECTEEEKRLKDQILGHYLLTQESSGEGDTDDEKDSSEESGATCSSTIEKNTNAQSVILQQKEKREQARAASAAKKHKDKEDREKQRRLRQEKREKKKAPKTEKKKK